MGKVHDNEIMAGRVVELVVYHCRHKHRFAVVGPHLHCRCSDPALLVLVEHGRTRNDAGCAAAIKCACGDERFAASAVRRAVLKAATSAYLVGGFDAIKGVLGLWDRPVARTTYDYPKYNTGSGRLFPSDFPTNDPKGYSR